MNKVFTEFSFKVVIALTAFVLLLFIYTRDTFDSEDFALGDATTSHFVEPYHFNKLNQESIDHNDSIWQKSGGKAIMLILGNSQTHSINQYKEGQNTYVKLLRDNFSDRYILSHSIQNAGMQDFLLSYSFIQSKFTLKEICLPVFFDDFREDGVRDIFFTKVLSDRFMLDSSLGSIATQINTELYATKDIESEKNEVSPSSQKVVESFLDSTLMSYSKTWAMRSDMRGKVFTQLYNLRNTIFNINAQTIRNVIPSRYSKNMQAFNAILDLSQKNGTTVYLYIPPIRNDVKIPYNLEDYSKFKEEVEQIARNYKNVRFSNFENIVPAKYWGMKQATNSSSDLEYDFMHFQYRGHELLDSALTRLIIGQN
jgi:hypothetical protein